MDFCKIFSKIFLRSKNSNFSRIKGKNEVFKVKLPEVWEEEDWELEEEVFEKLRGALERKWERVGGVKREGKGGEEKREKKEEEVGKRRIKVEVMSKEDNEEK